MAALVAMSRIATNYIGGMQGKCCPYATDMPGAAKTQKITFRKPLSKFLINWTRFSSMAHSKVGLDAL